MNTKAVLLRAVVIGLVGIFMASNLIPQRMGIPFLLFGLLVLLMGLFFWAISNPLAKLATNWNLFIKQDPDVLAAYRSMKLGRIRMLAKATQILGGVFVVGGLIGWGLGAR